MTEWIRCPKCDALMIAITSGHICPLCGYRVPVQTISNTTGTSAEYVQVIRCKDCKWFGNIGCAISIVDDTDKPSEYDYCSFAERKEE